MDASIYSRIAPVQMADPMDQYAKSLNLQNMMQSGDLDRLKMRQAQQGIDDETAVRDAYKQAGGDNARLRALLSGGGQYKQIQALDKHDLEVLDKKSTIGKNDAAAAKSRQDVALKNTEHFGALLGEAKDQASWDSVKRLGQVTGLLSADQVAKLPAEFNPQVISAMQSAAMTRVQQLADQRAREQQAETNRSHLENEGNMRRGQDMTAATARAGHGVTMRGQDISASTAIRGQNMTDSRSRELAQATREAAATGRIPPGYRTTATGNLEAIPGGPADTKLDLKAGETKKTLDAYVAARDGLLTGLAGTQTGQMAGRVTPWSDAQQIAEGGVAAMAPVLKQIFRVAGEGTFTDRDQEMLMNMVPTRKDNAGARAEKMANIDRIISAKMGLPVPAYKTATGTVAPANSVRSQADAILGGNR